MPSRRARLAVALTTGRWSLALLGVATLAAGCIGADRPLDPADSAEHRFEVPKGTTALRLGEPLEAAGLIASAWRWELYLRTSDEGRCLKAGAFSLRRSMSMRQIMQALCGAPIPDDVAFTVVEGWRVRDIDAALAQRRLIAPGAYADVATLKKVAAPFVVTSPTLEGYLYPETYMVPADPKRFSVEKLILRQLTTFKERFLEPHGAALGKRSLHEVVVMASMLEREEPTPANRPLVAGILWKRLDKGWQLGVDATSRYSLADWTDERAFRQKLKDPNDPYSTRVRFGLPPTAIGNPTQSALLAAIKPAPSDCWYYLHDSGGKLHCAPNAEEHEKNRARYQVY